MFEHSPEEGKASERLLSISRGNQQAADNMLEFWTLAAGSGWNEPSLKAAFHRGLNEKVLTEMACQYDNISLDDLIDIAICLDSLLHQRLSSCHKPCWWRLPPQLSLCNFPVLVWTPERERKHHNQLCFYCGQPNHLICLCPVRRKLPNTSARRSGVVEMPHTPAVSPFSGLYLAVLQVQIWLSETKFTLPALIDSGAAGNVID